MKDAKKEKVLRCLAGAAQDFGDRSAYLGALGQMDPMDERERTAQLFQQLATGNPSSRQRAFLELRVRVAAGDVVSREQLVVLANTLVLDSNCDDSFRADLLDYLVGEPVTHHELARIMRLASKVDCFCNPDLCAAVIRFVTVRCLDDQFLDLVIQVLEGDCRDGGYRSAEYVQALKDALRMPICAVRCCQVAVTSQSLSVHLGTRLTEIVRDELVAVERSDSFTSVVLSSLAPVTEALVKEMVASSDDAQLLSLVAEILGSGSSSSLVLGLLSYGS
jgi:hypothetical protein